MDTTTAALLIIPLAAIEIGLLVWGLWDLTRPERTLKVLSKPIWAVIILFIGIIGPLLYFLFGREES
jgi:Na+/H+ antiporter NhaD/arsenite permease-like protein